MMLKNSTPGRAWTGIFLLIVDQVLDCVVDLLPSAGQSTLMP